MCLLEKLCRLLCEHDKNIRIIPSIKVEDQSTLVAKNVTFYKPSPSSLRYLIMAFSITSSQQVTISVKFVDKKGNPAPVDGVPQWSTDNTDVFTLTPAADGMSCVCAAVGAIGDGKITLNADADLGAGVTPIIGTVDGSVTAGQATTVNLDVSTPSEQP